MVRRMLTARTSLFAAGIAFAMLAAAALGGVFAADDPETAQRAAVSAEAREALDALGIRSGGASIRQLKDEARTSPSAVTYANLGTAYLEAVRQTGNADGYVRAEDAFERALDLDARSYPALAGLATLAAARHEFPTALKLATRARAVRPGGTDALGILGDAQLELGRYEAAFDTFDEMAARKPSVASYTRVSYAREITGDRIGAIEAMSLAIDVSSAGTEPRAFALAHRGGLLRAEGNVASAEQDLRAALAAVPDYPPALIGLARIAFARGDHDAAIASAEQAARSSALPEHAMVLTQVLQGSGRADEARRADRLVMEAVATERAAGAELDFELAAWKVDRGQDLDAALATIRDTWRIRRSVDVADAMAWALVRTGRCEQARPFSDRALALGGVDGVKQFHRAELERCLGNRAEARRWYRAAIEADPTFSFAFAARARAFAG